MRNKIKQFLYLVKMSNIVYNSEYLDWRQKYDLIFSEEISQKIFKLFKIDYYDPDTSYQEDLEAFLNAINEKANGLKELIEDLGE